MRKPTMLFVASLIVLFGAGLPATSQEKPAKEDHPRIVAVKRLADVKAKLWPVGPPEDTLRSLAILEELIAEIRMTQIQLVVTMTQGTPPVRRQAAIMLGEVSKDPTWAPIAVKHLTERLDKEKEPEVIAGLYFGLARLAPYDKSTLPRFVAALKHADPRVRRAATVMFMYFRESDDVLIPVAISALDDPDLGPDPKNPGVNCPSGNAMMFMRTKRAAAKAAAPVLIKIAKGDKADADYRFRALWTLALVAPEERLSLDTARAWLKGTDDVERFMHGVAVLCELGASAKDALPELVAAAGMKPHPDPASEQRLKLGIVSCFRCMGPAAKEALPTLEALSATSDLTVRRQAIVAIKAIREQK